MKRNEICFIVAVAVFAVVFSALTLSNTSHVLTLRAERGAAMGVAGESRPVDTEKIKRLIREHYLSDHEAEFYRPAGPVPVSSVNTEAKADDTE